jgi:hypothetical protein
LPFVIVVWLLLLLLASYALLLGFKVWVPGLVATDDYCVTLGH